MKINNVLKMARLAAKTADEKLGQEILVLDVRGHSSVTDFFIFINAASHLHVRALEDAIREDLRESGALLQRTDGQRGSVWRVLDYGSILIHIMDAKTREFYSIERLWDQAKKVPLGFLKTKKNKAAPKKKRARLKPQGV